MSRYSSPQRAGYVAKAQNAVKNALWSIERAYMPPREGAPAAFILLTCLVDFLGTLYAGKKSTGETFKAFISDFMKQEYHGVGYDPEKLWKSLRNKLVHNYSLGDYLLVHNHPDLHLTLHRGATVLNQEDFFQDVRQAADDYFAHVAQETALQDKLSDRISEDGIIGDVQI
jgi:hypothetical protein